MIAKASTAAQVYASLKRSLAAIEREHQNSILCFAEILRRKLYRDLGYSSIWHLATQGLGFSRSRTAQYIRLAKAVDRLPHLKRAVNTGQVEWTKARELTRVANPQNEAAWVARAKQRSRRQLAAEVKAARTRPSSQTSWLDVPAIPAADPPVRVGFELQPEQLARYETLLEAIRKRGHRGSPADILLEALAALAQPGCPRAKTARPPYQVVVHRCDRCQQVTVPTTRGPHSLDRATVAAVKCDHDAVETDGANRSAIPPRLRRQVLARDGHRCRAPGCTHTQYLHLHHRVARERGGPNTLENLVTLCSTCHGLRHRNE